MRNPLQFWEDGGFDARMAKQRHQMQLVAPWACEKSLPPVFIHLHDFRQIVPSQDDIVLKQPGMAGETGFLEPAFEQEGIAPAAMTSEVAFADFFVNAVPLGMPYPCPGSIRGDGGIGRIINGIACEYKVRIYVEADIIVRQNFMRQEFGIA